MYYNKKSDEVLKSLNSSLKGLTDSAARSNLEKFGKNELIEKKGRSKLDMFISQFKSFIVYILIVAAIVSAVVAYVEGHGYIESIVILIILVFNAVFGYIQESKAEEAISALKKLVSLKATVIRDGEMQKIDTFEIVPGDILVIEAGDKISADARIIECENLQTQEASLTGESLPVKKTSMMLKEDLPLGDQKNMIFSGTIATVGRAKAVVTSTGMKTELGKIAGMIDAVEDEQTPLQKKLQKLGMWLGYATIIVSIVVLLTGLLRGEKFIIMFMASVALAVAVIPEGLPAVVTISLALGVQRMIRRNALLRNLPSVETLGATTVICTDKTGTLTKNEMTVVKLFSNSKVIDVTGSGYNSEGEFLVDGKMEKIYNHELLLRIGMLNNDSTIKGKEVIGDPTEASLLVSAAKAGMSREKLKRQYPRIAEMPFDSTTKRMITFHDNNGKRYAYIKGAPDVILAKCTKIYENGGIRIMSEQDRKKILDTNKEFASGALRVLGFAYKKVSGKFSETELTFVGLQAMIDPPRPGVKKAIQKCRDAGIRVVMVTGDFEGTAKAIGKSIGLTGKSIDGAGLDKIKDLDSEIENITIFSRVNPEHKIKIVESLQKCGHIVAMTGDGVNDAPALKKAHIGISMGIKGTDVAKESSDMILTDDHFASIVNAVEEGRGIDDNIKKFVNYLLSSNFGELLVLFIAMLIGFAGPDGHTVIPLIALQILWINLITDGPPALALGVDPIDKGIMKRLPRNPKERIMNKTMTLNILIMGSIIAAATLWMFKIGLAESAIKAQTMAFTTLVFLEIARLQIIRKQYHLGMFDNRYLVYAVLLSLGLQMMVLYTPLNAVFKVVPLALNEMGMILGITFAMYILASIFARLIRMWTTKID